eukprot:jgi/Bigna1/145759/aug1.103_g20467
MSQQLEEQQDFGSQAVQGHEQKQERKGDTDAKEGGGTPPQAPPGPAPGIKKADAAAEALENFYEADDEDVAAESKKVVMALRALRPRASNYAKLKVSIEYKYQTHDVWAAIMQDIMDYEADLPPEWAALFRNDGGLGASRGTTQSTVKQQQPVQRNTQFMSVKTAPVMITKYNGKRGDDQARFEEFKLKIKESTYVTEKGYTTMEAAVQAISLREQEQDRKFTSPKVPGIGNINAIKPQRDWYKDREGNRRCGYCSRKGKHTAKDCRDRKEGRPRMTIRQLNEHYEKLKRKKGRGQGYNNSKWQGSNNGKNNKYKNKKQNSINAIQQQINGILDHLKQAPTKTAVPATQDQDKPMTLDDIKNLGVCNINDEDANRTIKVAMTKVKVKDSYGDYKKLPALWDSGSMPKSFISLSTVRRLGLLDQVTKKERKYAQADGSSSMKTVGELMLKLQIPGSDAETQIKTRVAMTLSMELLLGQDALEKLGGIISFYNHKIYFAKLPKKSGRTISQNMIRLDEWTSESSVNALEFMDLADNKLPTPTELRKKNPGKTIRQITELLDKTPPADDWDIDKGKKYINKILNENSDITKPTTFLACSICLETLNSENKSVIEKCFHSFCLPCIKKWAETDIRDRRKRNRAKGRPEEDERAHCPLCKTSFTRILHSISSERDFKVINISSSSSTKTEVNHRSCYSSFAPSRVPYRRSLAGQDLIREFRRSLRRQREMAAVIRRTDIFPNAGFDQPAAPAAAPLASVLATGMLTSTPSVHNIAAIHRHPTAPLARTMSLSSSGCNRPTSSVQEALQLEHRRRIYKRVRGLASAVTASASSSSPSSSSSSSRGRRKFDFHAYRNRNNTELRRWLNHEIYAATGSSDNFRLISRVLRELDLYEQQHKGVIEEKGRGQTTYRSEGGTDQMSANGEPWNKDGTTASSLSRDYEATSSLLGRRPRVVTRAMELAISKTFLGELEAEEEEEWQDKWLRG